MDNELNVKALAAACAVTAVATFALQYVGMNAWYRYRVRKYLNG